MIPAFFTQKLALPKHSASRRLTYMWFRHYKGVFILLFLAVLAVCGAFWYYSLYGYSWSDQAKQQYLDAYFRETTFRQEEFQDLVGRLSAREQAHAAQWSLSRDIFSE